MIYSPTESEVMMNENNDVFIIQLQPDIYILLSLLLPYFLRSEAAKWTAYDIIPSLTVAEIKNRCIPCVYWGTAIFVVVMKYSNLFFSFAFFLDRSHFAFGYELIISSEAAGFMKIICNGFTLI